MSAASASDPPRPAANIRKETNGVSTHGVTANVIFVGGYSR